MNIPKVLAIDYGTQRIGIAVSFHTLAEPLEIIKNHQGALARIVELCQQNNVEKIIVGLSENEMAKKTERFVAELKKVISVPIVFFDETLSSHAVHQKLKTAKQSKRSGNIDHYAATEFLQEWIDENYS